jgi:hypothetical protein
LSSWLRSVKLAEPTRAARSSTTMHLACRLARASGPIVCGS